jgi:hypothetical protein
MMSQGESLAVNAIVWQRFPEGDGTVHTTIEINSGPHLSKLFNAIKSRYYAGKKMSFHPTRLLSLGAGFGTTAISSYYSASYKHTVIVGSSNPKAPMNYYTVDNLMVHLVKGTKYDFKLYNINIKGHNYTQEVSL